MRQKKNLFFLFVCLCSAAVQGQVVAGKDSAKQAPVAQKQAADSNLRIYAPARVQSVEQMVYQYQRYVRGASPGYRVQIDFGEDRNAVSKMKDDFTAKYPSVASYMIYKQPYFKLSVGDFRTRLEAVRFLNRVKGDYPAAFVVADKIMPPPL